MNPIRFNLRDELEDAIRPLAARAHEKALKLRCEWGSEVPQYVVGDAVRIRQVVLNLLGNAIKFTHQGEVALEIARESGTADQVVLHFVVRDTGIGIPLDKQKLIFEAFAQADGTTTRNYGGTGLGLSISTRLVEAMQGRIWVVSTPGQGSAFHFTARLGLGPDLKIAGDSSFWRGLQVLVVDDNVTNLRVVTDVLRNWEMKPVSAASGSEALMLIRRAYDTGDPFTLIIADSHMPGMDGNQLAKEIKTSPYRAGALVLMLPSEERPGDIGRARELGVSDYLTKPVRKEELRDVIARALDALRQDSGTRQPVPHFVNSPPAASTARILLAEDNLVNQRVVQVMLEKRGYRVVVAGNGREALEALRKDTFDLVLMDVQMPEMDGLEATRALRDTEQGSGIHLPVIALTAHAMKGDLDRCLAAGMDGYLSKPIPAAELLRTIETYTHGESRSRMPA